MQAIRTSKYFYPRDNKEKHQLMLICERPSSRRAHSSAMSMRFEIGWGSKVACVSLGMSRESRIMTMKGELLEEEVLRQVDYFDDSSLVGSLSKMDEMFCDRRYDYIVIDYFQLIDCEGLTIKDVQKRIREFSYKWRCDILLNFMLPRVFDNKEARDVTLEDLESVEIVPGIYNKIEISY